jgi:predicted ATPase
MVSEISPIVSYLRFIVNYSDKQNNPFMKKRKFEKGKPLIIIEEPEAHLHPDIQIKLLKQFAELAKNDVKFIITTHSNYMFHQFNNLIIAKEIKINSASAFLFQETKSGTEIIDMEFDEFGIEDNNFIQASENLYNEKLYLIEKLNNQN